MPLDNYTCSTLLCCSIESFKEFINICLENREVGRIIVIESHILSALDRNRGDSSLQIKKQITELSISRCLSFLTEDPKDCKKRQEEVKIKRENNNRQIRWLRDKIF